MGDARWCRHGLGSAVCCEQHIREVLPPGPGRGRNRECPECQANLSVNPGDRGMWVIWCCQGGCQPDVVRDALLALRIDPKCLGTYGSDEWKRRQQRSDFAGLPARADGPTYAAARKFYAWVKLREHEPANASLRKMCEQAVIESDGHVSGDPEHLLPRDYKEFVALAKRTGLERCYAAKLARQWLTK